jgi:hypothetical protein
MNSSSCLEEFVIASMVTRVHNSAQFVLSDVALDIKYSIWLYTLLA